MGTLTTKKISAQSASRRRARFSANWGITVAQEGSVERCPAPLSADGVCGQLQSREPPAPALSEARARRFLQKKGSRFRSCWLRVAGGVLVGTEVVSHGL